VQDGAGAVQDGAVQDRALDDGVAQRAAQDGVAQDGVAQDGVARDGVARAESPAQPTTRVGFRATPSSAQDEVSENAQPSQRTGADIANTPVGLAAAEPAEVIAQEPQPWFRVDVAVVLAAGAL